MGPNNQEQYFPYAVPRPGQLSLIHSIQEEAANGNHLCVEAVNGFGKTIANISKATTNVTPKINAIII